MTTYAMPYQPHLPPIHQHQQQPPTSQGSYLPPSYRQDLPRMNSSGPAQLTGRYQQAPQFQPQGVPSGFSSAPLLPQPSHQALNPQGYPPTTTTSQAYQPRIAPAPVRTEYAPMSATPFSQPDNRPSLWSSSESVPNVLTDASREQPTTHVVGSQGRRGILPSAPGRATVTTNGVNGASKGAAMPAKDADGKFPCPNCNKTYLHAKHLKRHLLRHTGDRPYMCILCKDTFSRSDILKRHFQKCSVRRGNPTGASHLSNPAAHFKKSQNANNQAKSNANSPVSGTNAAGLMPSTNLRQNTRHTNGTFSSKSSNFSDAPANPFSTATTTPNALHPATSHQTFGPQTPVGSASNGAWASIQQAARSNNHAMYPSASSASPHHYGLPASSAEERKSTMSVASGVGEEWNQMFQPGESQEYIFPSSMGGSYQGMQSHVDVKKEYDQTTAEPNGYYMAPTNLGADGTLGPLLWNLASTLEDPLQLKGDRLVDFCFPGGIQDSLLEQQSNANFRACLAADNIKHFLEQFSHFQGHFPFLHMASFDFAEAYDGLILAIICIGAVYSDRVSQVQVRGLMQRAKYGIECSSILFQQAQNGDDIDSSQPRPVATLRYLEEIQALLLLYILFTWHGGPAERATARSDSRKLIWIIRRYRLLELVESESEGYSFFHNLQLGEQPDHSRWDWATWVSQEMRLRVTYLVFLYHSALVLYFNCEPELDPSEIRLPLPCDDAAWDATTSGKCASALGMNGPDQQQALNQAGSLRLKQLDMHHAIEALYSPTLMFQPRTTNVFSKFILTVHRYTKICILVHRSATIERSATIDFFN
ncbi:hypothetical protein GJ744_012477 [Endocarpon pusillum]|uniref:C2H2-type domain-containing protein n=1 Tax=Endocarpon pusillum TaxID=364733 RepID=A0A8H7E209_9EURO|nr:hypothetical protein GJ744_012477 [Endocarpon pusillum]